MSPPQVLKSPDATELEAAQSTQVFIAAKIFFVLAIANIYLITYPTENLRPSSQGCVLSLNESLLPRLMSMVWFLVTQGSVKGPGRKRSWFHRSMAAHYSGSRVVVPVTLDLLTDTTRLPQSKFKSVYPSHKLGPNGVSIMHQKERMPSHRVVGPINFQQPTSTHTLESERLQTISRKQTLEGRRITCKRQRRLSVIEMIRRRRRLDRAPRNSKSSKITLKINLTKSFSLKSVSQQSAAPILDITSMPQLNERRQRDRCK
ncbi:hypothetical protein SISNIDRAFT_471466 [Sistotremastrum niveocremeum HHB9708]|uniref:Uncharacterized protein n=1 Tax=Sistotremastrum niveocremeum HHB9708 TaxID=1314777 RepID=A0A164MLL6_9AGAM|nr:hypothetical protein SISNIDRAFT_471466 [Sistotremastrum niveocremeum HHB9708]